jgi:hypothetical protein
MNQLETETPILYQEQTLCLWEVTEQHINQELNR